MVRIFSVLAIWLLSVLGADAQQVVDLFDPQEILLKGQTKAMFGGNYRSTIPISLPANTVRWIYAYVGQDESDMRHSIDLKKQIEAQIAAGGVNNIDVEKLNLPQGSLSCDIYVCSADQIRSFNNSDALGTTTIYHQGEYSRMRRRQGVADVTTLTSGQYYLGIVNDNSLETNRIRVEAVAITGGTSSLHLESSEGSIQKAEMFGKMAWKKIESGDYESALTYAQKSRDQKQLGWVDALTGLAQLMLGNESTAIDTYIEAIILISEQENGETLLKEHYDLLTKTTSGKSISGTEDVRVLINSEM
ncbi:MAG: hypothetical protein WEC59_04715 [Salibacteraceae bacterium]